MKSSSAINSEIILYERESKSRLNGEKVIFQIVAIPSGGRPWYPEYIKKLDKIIYIRLIKDGTQIDYPFTEDEPFKLWEAMLDVWVRPEKKAYYIDKYLSLILRKKGDLNATNNTLP